MGRWTLLWSITNNQNEPRLSPWASYLLHGNGQPVKPLLWQLWTSIIQLSSLGVVKKSSRRQVLLFCLCLSACTCHQPGLLYPPGPRWPQGLSTTQHCARFAFWIFSSAKKTLFAGLRYTLCGIWSKHLQLPFFFPPSSPFPGNIMFS